MNALEERPSAGTPVVAAGLLTLVPGCLLLPIGAMYGRCQRRSKAGHE